MGSGRSIVGRTQHTNTAARRPGPSRVWAFSRLCLLICLPTALCPLLTACRPNKRYDLIEAELRTRERELIETRAALDRARTLNHSYEQARGPEFPGAPPPVPAPVGGGCPVKEISIGRGTGGVDDDGIPGDEALMVVIVPTDEDRSAVKVPARATVVAWEINPQGLKNPIGTWELGADQLRPTWRSGLLATGYFVTLPWQTAPAAERVRVAVRLTTTDGRAFEADRDVSVHLTRYAVPRGTPAPAPIPPATPSVPPGGRQPLFPGTPPTGVPPVIPPGVEELPPPAGLMPGRGAQLLPPEKQ
ncbi:MAG: hypothetical protein JWO38_2529 [Gemmataceae bacterium]|nr:hypothetical protein [Gemmataceae bacterium]